MHWGASAQSHDKASCCPYIERSRAALGPGLIKGTKMFLKHWRAQTVEDATRQDLFRVLEGVRARVWVPYQAAREFYRNRIEVIGEQRRKYVELVPGAWPADPSPTGPSDPSA